MIKRILLLLLLLNLTCCKAQKMNTVTLDPQGETKQLYDNSMFKEYFDTKEDNSIVEKKSQKPFSGTLTVNYHSGEIFATYIFVNGKQEGNQISYYLNGNKQSDVTIKGGKYEGAFHQYYENGTPKSLGKFNYGKQVSLISYFDLP